MPDKKHWDKVYRGKTQDALSWYQPEAAQSLALIEQCAIPREAPIIDVGGGASTLAADLLQRGYRDLWVLDISAAALAAARDALGDDGSRIHWLESDVTRARLPAAHFALWHDRAVFHFLTEPASRAAYRDTLLGALRPDGQVIIATFAEDGPQSCSGLPVMRYDAEAFQAEFSPALELLDTERHEHRTPSGQVQWFRYCRLERADR